MLSSLTLLANFCSQALAQNTAPEFTTPSSLDDATEFAAYSQIIAVKDVDNDTVTISIVDGPEWLSISETTNNGDTTATAMLSGTPDYMDPGSNQELLLRVDDNIQSTDSTFYINVINTQPTMNITAPQATDGVTPFEVIFMFSEPVTSFSLAKITAAPALANATAGNFVAHDLNNGYARIYTVDLQPTGGNIAKTFRLNSASDYSGQQLLSPASFSVVEDATKPYIDKVTPNTGTASGGDTVTISGINFGAGASVRFGNSAARSETYIDVDELSAVVPEGSGTVDVSVTFGGQTATLAGGFTYVPPNIPPRASDDSAVGDVGELVAGNLLTNDQDDDGPGLAVVDLHIGAAQKPLGSPFSIAGFGTLNVESDGDFTFAPLESLGEGTVPTITYTLSDLATPTAGTDSASLKIGYVHGGAAAPANTPPTAILLSNDEVPEDADTANRNIFVANLSIEDGEGDAAISFVIDETDTNKDFDSFTLGEGVDFGKLYIAQGTALTAGTQLTVDVTVTDDGVPFQEAATFPLTIDIVAANVAPVITAPNNGKEATVNVPEGTTDVTDVDATDANSDPLEFTIVNGFGDADHFNIDLQTGVVTFKAPAGSKLPSGEEDNMAYDLSVEVSDGELSATQIIHVVVDQVDETRPTVEIIAPGEVRETFEAIVEFSEPVNGFVQDGMTVENANISGFEGGDGETTFTVTLRPIKLGRVTLSVAEAVARDLADNVNRASTVVVVTYIDEATIIARTHRVLGNLLSQRVHLSLGFQPSFARRRQRLSGNYQNTGEINAFGLSYRDSRLPARVTYEKDKVQFNFSLLQSRADGTVPSLTGRLAINQIGLPTGSRRPGNPDPLEPVKLVDSLGLDRSRHGQGNRATFLDLGENSRPAPLSPSAFDARHKAAVPDADKRIDVWMEGIYGAYETKQNEGTFGILHMGLDYLPTPNVLVGIGTQIDWLEMDSTDDESEAEGIGFMIGPYMTVRLARKLLFDGRLSWGMSNNEISPFDTYTDQIESERWLASGALIGEFKITDNLTMLPEARLSWYHEDSEDYTDSLAVDIPSTSVESGTLDFGPIFHGNFELADSGKLQPFLGAKGIWTFAHDLSGGDSDGTENLPQSEEGVRVRLEAGVNLSNELAESLLISLSGFYDGLGNDGFEVWGGNVRLNRAF
ncbi:MAG: autotransporter domain-containing protein [Rhizobiaceae bacterium]